MLGPTQGTMQQRYYDPIAMRFLSVDPAQSEFSRYSYGANNPYKFVDPDGREIVFVPGTTETFKAQYNEAVSYLKEGGVGDVISRFEARSETLFIAEGSGLNDVAYYPDEKMIEANLNSGWYVSEGNIQSPALGLLHEFGHAEGDFDDPAGYESRRTTSVEGYGNAEEQRVIDNLESPAALRLGEPTRNTLYSPIGGIKVECATCSKNSQLEQDKLKERERDSK
jgi:uncharacterized protein RhaS with RHS repeats